MADCDVVIGIGSPTLAANKWWPHTGTRSVGSAPLMR